jgi:hypothetical protein
MVTRQLLVQPTCIHESLEFSVEIILMLYTHTFHTDVHKKIGIPFSGKANAFILPRGLNEHKDENTEYRSPIIGKAS